MARRPSSAGRPSRPKPVKKRPSRHESSSTAQRKRRRKKKK